MNVANIKNFSKYLKDLDACSSAVDWAKGKSLKTAWNTVNQANWMMWLLGKNVDAEGWPSRETVVLLSCAIARKVLKYVPEGEDRPRLAIEAAEKWAAGKETLENVEDAAVSAYSADLLHRLLRLLRRLRHRPRSLVKRRKRPREVTGCKKQQLIHRSRITMGCIGHGMAWY